MSEKNNNLMNTMLSVIDPLHVFRHHETADKKNGKPRRLKFTTSRSLEALIFLGVHIAGSGVRCSDHNDFVVHIAFSFLL